MQVADLLTQHSVGPTGKICCVFGRFLTDSEFRKPGLTKTDCFEKLEPLQLHKLLFHSLFPYSALIFAATDDAARVFPATSCRSVF